MRVLVTGQVGLDKKPFLNSLKTIAANEGQDLAICNIGDMMYAEAPDVGPGKILDLPLSRLNSLRRSVFKDVLHRCGQSPNVIVNTHATFRWRHGLFYAFDYDQTKALDADLYIVLVDNVDRVHYRLNRDGHVDHTLKDLMVWREEEMLATELLAQIVRGHGRFYIMARGDGSAYSTATALVRLMFQPAAKKAYLSFPMSHVHGAGAGAILTEIENFRRVMKRHFVCFDPGDVEEKHLCSLALSAAQQGRRNVEFGPAGEKAVMETSQLLDIIADIDGQIYARDFKLIDQADMIVSLIPQLPSGKPGLSSGVERELQHAHEATKDVFVIWQGADTPSPFVTQTATRLFRTVEQAVEYFMEHHYIAQSPCGGLFG
jgi:adenylate kinase